MSDPRTTVHTASGDPQMMAHLCRGLGLKTGLVQGVAMNFNVNGPSTCLINLILTEEQVAQVLGWRAEETPSFDELPPQQDPEQFKKFKEWLASHQDELDEDEDDEDDDAL